MEIINARPMPESHVKRVAAYCRISMETDRTHKSLSTQISHYNELIGSTPGWVFAGVFADNGISGTSIEGRTEFIRMIDKARAGEIDIILTKSVSRFARNTVDLLSVVRELRSMGVEVRFERENISTLLGEGELLLTLLASFAQAESDQQSQSVKWGIRRRFQQGQHNGFSLYGYTNHGKGRVEINEAEAAVVRRIFDYYLAKVSAEQMARIFEAEGVVGPTGAALEATTIRNILRNEKYTGNSLFQKHITISPGGHSKLNEGEQDQYWVEDTHPAIIDLDVWQQVQDERENRRSQGAKANWSIPTSDFTHMLFCPLHDKYYRASVRTLVDGTKRRSWSCAAKRDGEDCPNSKRIPNEALEALVCEALDLDEFDAQTMTARITRIVIHDQETAEVEYADGTTSRHTIHYPQKRYQAYWDTPGVRERHGQRLRAYWANLSEEEYGHQCEIRRQKRSKESEADKARRKQKISDAWTPERRAKQAEVARRTNAKLGPEGRSKRAATISNDPAVAAAKSKRMKELWADPEWRERTLAAQHAAGARKRKEGEA